MPLPPSPLPTEANKPVSAASVDSSAAELALIHGSGLKRLGLAKRRAARLVGMRPAKFSRYESGVLKPGKLTIQRLNALYNLEPASEYFHKPYFTMAALAAAIKREVVAASNDQQSQGIRLIAQAITDRRRLELYTDLNLFFAEPSSTGDQRWDALLAGVAEREAISGHYPVPAWTATKRLDQLWWMTRAPGLRATSFRDTPISLKVRGVILSARNLESV